jgi:L-aspartate oxidase
MVQFHPTALWLGAGARGQQPLVSEAVRGEGAVLIDDAARRIMAGAHPLADLAPRDVVSATIAAHLAATGAEHVWLDATAVADVVTRFPGIAAACRAAGFDLAREPVPVAPAAHYTCGGVLADLDGRTRVPGLYAVGEVACTGVQGANRLASNSVTEGLVAGRRCAELLAASLPGGEPGEPAPTTRGQYVDPAARAEITAGVSRQAGVLRHAAGLGELAGTLAAVARGEGTLDLAAVETTALHTVATLLAAGALARNESRGCHRRTDAPETRPEWRVRLVHRVDALGHLHTRTERVRTAERELVVA